MSTPPAPSLPHRAHGPGRPTHFPHIPQLQFMFLCLFRSILLAVPMVDGGLHVFYAVHMLRQCMAFGST